MSKVSLYGKWVKDAAFQSELISKVQHMCTSRKEDSATYTATEIKDIVLEECGFKVPNLELLLEHKIILHTEIKRSIVLRGKLSKKTQDTYRFRPTCEPKFARTWLQLELKGIQETSRMRAVKYAKKKEFNWDAVPEKIKAYHTPKATEKVLVDKEEYEMLMEVYNNASSTPEYTLEELMHMIKKLGYSVSVSLK